MSDMKSRRLIRSPRRRGRCGQTHGLPFRHLRHLSRINPIQADYSFAQALWIALALFRDLDDGFGNQRGHGGLTVIHFQSRKGKLVCGDDGREVFRAKYRPFLCLFLLQKGMDRHTANPTQLRTSARRRRDVAYFTAAVCSTRDFAVTIRPPLAVRAKAATPRSILPTSLTPIGVTSTPNDGATD